MSDNKEKVIDLFKKSIENEEKNGQKFFKGFPYIKLTKDDNGNYFKENSLIDYANKCFYIVSVVRKNLNQTALYKYNIPYNSLLEFIDEFKNNNSYGTIIDIERYIPEDLA